MQEQISKPNIQFHNSQQNKVTNSPITIKQCGNNVTNEHQILLQVYFQTK